MKTCNYFTNGTTAFFMSQYYAKKILGEQFVTFEEILDYAPYSLDRDQKKKILTERLRYLTDVHSVKCEKYAQILNSVSYCRTEVSSYEDLPFLPVRLFKELALKSVADDEVVKTMTSSGTSGQAVSKIYLNKTTSANQQKAMVKIVNDFTGSSRMPMIIIDCPSVVKDRKMFSARGAGILGFSIFGSKKIYALDDNMQLNLAGIKEFLEKYSGQKILLFGFTFMIWQHFYKELLKKKEETGETIDLSNAILIHGGGWKKLISESVSSDEFKQKLTEVCGLSDVHDYYGMVEQTGCIYMQCECGHLHASIFSDVIIRNPRDFSVCAHGEKGIIQVVSTIPESYPGHSLLTEDEGIILGEDDCPCGRKGKYFKILGRLKNAEIRGCSDTYAEDHCQRVSGAVDKVYRKIEFKVGSSDRVKALASVDPLEPFSDEIVEFCDAVSKVLMKDRNARAFADVVTLGFWLRKANLNILRKQYYHDDDNKNKKIGRGVAFHIAPSNVPVNFAYSLFAGLLMGNANIVRIPSKDFPQVEIVCQAIRHVLEKFEQIQSYILLVKYERDSAVNDLFSKMCDVRIIWGGDVTIAELRKSELPPRATEITFADRYSLAVINSDYYIAMTNKEQIALDFYNDTYLSDQNACTSPRVVVWTGKQKESAKEFFWKSLYDIVGEKYIFQPIQGVDKLSMLYLLAADENGQNGKITHIDNKDNVVYRICIDKLSPNLMNYRGNSGYFYEYDCDNILEIRDFCNDLHCQTIGYLGDKAEIQPLLMSGIKGVDRVVPIGHTMDFDLMWDGYNLVDRLTRVVAVR